jgi:hypothetical protein
VGVRFSVPWPLGASRQGLAGQGSLSLQFLHDPESYNLRSNGGNAEVISEFSPEAL